MNTNKKTARKAGFLYLGYIIFTAIALVIGRKGIIVDGDAAATAANIIAKGTRFRIGFVELHHVESSRTPFVAFRAVNHVLRS